VFQQISTRRYHRNPLSHTPSRFFIPEKSSIGGQNPFLSPTFSCRATRATGAGQDPFLPPSVACSGTCPASGQPADIANPVTYDEAIANITIVLGGRILTGARLDHPHEPRSVTVWPLTPLAVAEPPQVAVTVLLSPRNAEAVLLLIAVAVLLLPRSLPAELPLIAVEVLLIPNCALAELSLIATAVLLSASNAEAVLSLIAVTVLLLPSTEAVLPLIAVILLLFPGAGPPPGNSGRAEAVLLLTAIAVFPVPPVAEAVLPLTATATLWPGSEVAVLVVPFCTFWVPLTETDTSRRP
jgi:hypothetical protein